MAALSENSHSPKAVAELMARPACRSLLQGHLIQTLVILTGAGHVHPAQRDERSKQRGRAARRSTLTCASARGIPARLRTWGHR